MTRKVIAAALVGVALCALAGTARAQKTEAFTTGFFPHEANGEAQVVLENKNPKPLGGGSGPSCGVNVLVIDQAGDVLSTTPVTLSAQAGSATEVTLPAALGDVGIARVDVEYTKAKECSKKTLGGAVYPHPENDPNAGLAGRKYELQVRASSRAQ